jgi:hypothetical protein
MACPKLPEYSDIEQVDVSRTEMGFNEKRYQALSGEIKCLEQSVESQCKYIFRFLGNDPAGYWTGSLYAPGSDLLVISIVGGSFERSGTCQGKPALQVHSLLLYKAKRA